MHWLLGRIRLCREQVVDRQVAGRLADRRVYLEALLDVARGLVRARTLPAPLMLRDRHLKDRIELLLEEVDMSRKRIAHRERKPGLSARSKENKVEGIVLLDVTLEKSGEVSKVNVVKGPEALREAAAVAVRQWRYEPSEVGPTLATITVRFTLDKSPGAEKP